MGQRTEFNQKGFGLAGVLIIILAIAVVVLGGWRVWDATRSSDSTKATQADQTSKNTGTGIVQNPTAGTPDLVSFLKNDGEGCPSSQQSQFKIIQELPTRFAKLGYGCSNTNSFIFAQFKNGQWSLISPTDQFLSDGTPSCEMVYAHAISKQIAPKCAVLGSSELRANPFN